jgi:transcription-repair coupling factor (superfamily II helicase)
MSFQTAQTFTALGSGYELARRDMELRGHGNIFGAEQSGAQDIGLDLEAKILVNAIELYKQKNWNDEIRE